MAERKVFADCVTALPDEPGLTEHGLMVQSAGPEHRREQISVLFSLEPKNETDLENRVARGDVVPVDELQHRYGADPADRKKLVAWLKRQHFEVTEVSPDGTGVYARANVGQVEKSLDVDMVRVTKDGVTYTAAKNAPSLPADVGKNVHAIIGLQPFRQAHKQFRMAMPHNGTRASLHAAPRWRAARSSGAARAKVATVAAEGPATNIVTAPPLGYLVSEILTAYCADRLPVTGLGQTIAILIDTFPADRDIELFWAYNGLPQSITRIEKVNVTDALLPPPTGEVSMDTEWSSGIAPGANIRIYATGTLAFVDLDRALDRILADLAKYPDMRQLSISLGLGETYMVADEVRTQHMKFLRLAAAGVNVFVSSGDAGSRPDPSGHSATGPTQAEYESSDRSVIGVGGTTLYLSKVGAVASEVGWVGSGGGESIFFSRPGWQIGAGVPAGTQRLVPDLSLVGDPNTGAFVVVNGMASRAGGTSLSAPVWAGFCALINEARARANKPFLPFLNPLIYPLLGTDCFRDITAGTNGDYTAGAGYDMVTGIGVPNVAELINALTSPSSA